MADAGLNLELAPELADRLRAAADSAGVGAEALALDILHDALSGDWVEDEARFAEYERTGVSYPAAAALERFRTAVERRVAIKRR